MILALVIAPLAAAASLAVGVVVVGAVLHRFGWEVNAGPEIGAGLLVFAAWIGALSVRPLGLRGRAALGMGGLGCLSLYLPLAIVAPDRTAGGAWAAPPAGAAHSELSSRFQPVLLLDSRERARPWSLPPRVTRSGDRVAIEYWWAFAENRSPSLLDAGCLPVLAVRRWTRFDHDGDIEGVTVFLRAGRPEAVFFASHSGGSRRAWRDLLRMGSREGGRPRVFVARGSHWSYPQACATSCIRPETGLLGMSLGEGTHDGAVRFAPDTIPVNLDGQTQCLLPALCVRGDVPRPLDGRERDPLRA